MRQGVSINPRPTNERAFLGTRLPADIIRHPLRVCRGHIANPVSGAVIAIALPLTEPKDDQT